MPMHRDNNRNAPVERDRWQIESDVRTLKEAHDIKNDPARLKDAQDMIRKTRATESEILNMKPNGNDVSRKRNPATVGALPMPMEY